MIKPAQLDFRVRPAPDTPLIGVVLFGRDPRTYAVVRLPVPGAAIAWDIVWASGLETKTTAPGEGLVVDRRTGAIYYPVSDDNLADLSRGLPAETRIRLVMSRGVAITYAEGTVRMEGIG